MLLKDNTFLHNKTIHFPGSFTRLEGLSREVGGRGDAMPSYGFSKASINTISHSSSSLSCLKI